MHDCDLPFNEFVLTGPHCIYLVQLQLMMKKKLFCELNSMTLDEGDYKTPQTIEDEMFRPEN